MINDAKVNAGGRTIRTRLHDHGNDGYLDGLPEDMQTIKAESPEQLVFHHHGVRTVLKGIVWGEASESYPGHWILYLTWAGEQQFGKTAE